MHFIYPISVHQLMPGDIRVVGALGDSLTVRALGKEWLLCIGAYLSHEHIQESM